MYFSIATSFTIVAATFFVNRVLLNERYSDYIDVGFFYYYLCKDTEQFLFRNQMAKYVELLPNNARILDFGSGPGIMSEFFTRQMYYGVDIDETRIAQARKMYDAAPVGGGTSKFFHIKNVGLGEGVGATLPFPDDFFDAVLFNDCIHHISTRDMKLIAQEIRRVIRDDGVVIIREPRKNTRFFTWLITVAVENGQYMRTDREYVDLFGDENEMVIIHEESRNYGIRDYYVALLALL